MWPFNGCADDIHQFEPRYDKGAADIDHDKIVASANERTLEALRPLTYVRDVCVRCGATVERQIPPSTNAVGRRE